MLPRMLRIGPPAALFAWHLLANSAACQRAATAGQRLEA